MKRDNIIGELICILNKTLRVPNEKLVQANFDRPLTGFDIGLGTNEMFYLFLEVSKHFNVEITYDDLCDYKFNTMNCIVNTLEKALS